MVAEGDNGKIRELPTYSQLRPSSSPLLDAKNERKIDLLTRRIFISMGFRERKEKQYGRGTTRGEKNVALFKSQGPNRRKRTAIFAAGNEERETFNQSGRQRQTASSIYQRLRRIFGRRWQRGSEKKKKK